MIDRARRLPQVSQWQQNHRASSEGVERNDQFGIHVSRNNFSSQNNPPWVFDVFNASVQSPLIFRFPKWSIVRVGQLSDAEFWSYCRDRCIRKRLISLALPMPKWILSESNRSPQGPQWQQHHEAFAERVERIHQFGIHVISICF